jgi:hypothetical protein
VKPPRSGPYDFEALLESERDIPAVPAHLRARAIQRARRAVVEARSTSYVPRRPARLRWAIAAMGLLAVGALATAAISMRQAPATSAAAPSEASAPPTTRASAPEARIEPPELDLTSLDLPARPATTRPPRRALTRAEEYAQELRLLHPAREAIGRGDFVLALAATAAHERRFPHGRLAEEREALRIVALAGARRASEARAAAEAFHGHFPSSLLRKRVDEAVGGLR